VSGFSKKTSCAFLALAFFFALVSLGCGKKAPPEPLDEAAHHILQSYLP